MKSSIIITLLVFAVIGCSELNKNITSPEGNSFHPQGKSFITPGSPDFHGALVENANYSMIECTQCHASNYNGGPTASSCLTCHTFPGGPESCNTCHGDFSIPINIAPPRALNGGIQTTIAGVGAHTKHLSGNTLGKRIECSTCHTIPRTFYEDGHLGSDNRAEVVFNNLAIHGGIDSANYSFSNVSCSNTYCHGNIKNGNNVEVIWNQVDGTQASCGTCHGLPPGGNHPNVAACQFCHASVVGPNFQIINKDKHINGTIDFN